ncbi:sigma-54-dependent Fis family transcriptional regulator [Cognatazoarcus halotolerans]|uniref:sigma-54-dependent Fis family transcriptional regulator n=1 Tax=Cognatazoarcus halotolerans TaxID=2686016 RepID=UPI0013588C1D|nr:sigma-54-dependent Fis family transcriptional regulator [Cognatazoarcus halotolerans]MCB1900175.1 sigma-54-dependent Fis family transcriptional regulator [Rhodocyclaceae bacterium]MCP5308633.1 sigma-54-dependent Fis family transcriptional regulator [Zoogloeaceae bacterium]
MRQSGMPLEVHNQRLHEARKLFLDRGSCPDDLVARAVLRSWERCRGGGLDDGGFRPTDGVVTTPKLREACERNSRLIAHAQGIMEHVYEQIRASDSLVVLSDPRGMLIHRVGDPEFVSRAQRVALQPGAIWDESMRGTNAIGTALVEQSPIEIVGGEHFLGLNGFLTCSAAPIFDPQGRMVGAIDISGDYRTYQRHTLGLVRLSAQLLEKRLFESEYARELQVSFHPRPEHVGSMQEGLLAVSCDGNLLGINPVALELLGLRRGDLNHYDFGMIFATPLNALIDRASRDPHSLIALDTRSGERLYAMIRGALPKRIETSPSHARPLAAAGATRQKRRREGEITLDDLRTGDERLNLAIQRATRVVGKDIPMLIQGESGVGKELFAKAFHQSSDRSAQPFVALNCAAIPENLIESELFGYLGGAFTGARKEGMVGKIQQADGGTLFLDEIGDMPLNLQARLLRVLQERCVTPLGGVKSVPVNLSLVCATHRRLRDEVARGSFREDLFYRINGLTVSLPALRDRSDIAQLVENLLAIEAGGDSEISVAEDVLEFFGRYDWPGNIRQLHNVIRVAIALLDEGETVIRPVHLPEELFGMESDSGIGEPKRSAPQQVMTGETLPRAAPLGAGATARLDQIELDAIQRALNEAGGNVSAAARRLGISRNTLYRKLGRF